MANIVGSNLDRKSELERARKEMWNHKPFGEIYSYASTIGRVKELSKMPVTGMIDQIAKEWGEIDLDSIIMGNLPNARGEKFRFTKHGLNKVAEDDTASPHDVYASVIEIADTNEWCLGPTHPEDAETINFMHYTLRDYLTMGLYPLVYRPVTPGNINDSMLRMDAVVPSSNSEIGVIVGLIETDEGSEYRCGAIVMWDPDFTNEYGEPAFGTGCGVLKLRNGLVTPDLWKETCKHVHVDDAFFAPSFYVPVFELSLHTTEVNRVVFCPQMTDLVNECFVSGRISLDFANFMQEKLKKTTEALVRVCQATGIQVDDNLNPIFPEGKDAPSADKPSHPAPAPKPNLKPGSMKGDAPQRPEPEVPVEDAADDWASFMRGLDEAAPIDRPRDVYSGMMDEALNDGTTFG